MTTLPQLKQLSLGKCYPHPANKQNRFTTKALGLVLAALEKLPQLDCLGMAFPELRSWDAGIVLFYFREEGDWPPWGLARC